MRLKRRALRTLGTVIAVLLLAGCKSWRPSPVSPAQVVSEERPRAVRITDIDGDVVTIRHPTVRNDSIVTADTDPFGAPVLRPGVPFGDVNMLEVEQFDGRKTLIATALGVTATLVWASVARTSEGGQGEQEPPDTKGFDISLLSGLRALVGVLR